ncbi:hypothetical protein D3C81_1592060 [compost metagenome]
MVAQWGQQTVKPTGKHSFPCAWRPNQQQVVAASRGDFQRALALLLTNDVAKILQMFRHTDTTLFRFSQLMTPLQKRAHFL